MSPPSSSGPSKTTASSNKRQHSSSSDTELDTPLQRPKKSNTQGSSILSPPMSKELQDLLSMGTGNRAIRIRGEPCLRPEYDEDYISGLETRSRILDEMSAFVITNRYALEASPAIRRHLQTYPNSSTDTAAALRRSIDDTYETQELRSIYPESDDPFSNAMEPYVGKIRVLSMIPGGLEPALRLLMRLAGMSVDGKADDHGVRFALHESDRPSDEPADRLMVELLVAARDCDLSIIHEINFDDLKRLATLLKEHRGCETYFPLSLELVGKWEKEDKARS